MLALDRIPTWLCASFLSFLAGCTSTEVPLGETSSDLPPSESTEQPAESVESSRSDRVVDRPLTVPPDNPDPTTQQQVQQFLNQLAAQGFPSENQGIWVQAGETLLANHQGTKPRPAASVTKVATALAALQVLRPDHQFITEFGVNGPIEDGVLKGDLVVRGEGDPLFIWEEAMAVGNLLAGLGINRVTGNLIVSDTFYMNFYDDPQLSGELLKEGLNARIWSEEAEIQYQTLPPGTPRPQIEIEGSVEVMSSVPNNIKPLVRHHSPPLTEQLKLMNRYSNNMVAQTLADAVGGAGVVMEKAIEATGVPPEEIQLINGSGLGEENQISPRAAVAMFVALNRILEPLNLTVADVVAIVGQDEGILDVRSLPVLSVVKSGSLNQVSTIAGGVPTQERGTVWIAIMNGGVNMEGFRNEQDALLGKFVNQWGAVSSAPFELTPNRDLAGKNPRSEIVQEN